MAFALDALTIDAIDPGLLAPFWSGLLGREMAEDARGGVTLVAEDSQGFAIRFVATKAPKIGQNQMHLDLTSTSHSDQERTVARALALGGRHLDVGQGSAATHVVLADPEGNELCVIAPGNNFLADCGFIGALACDGSQEVGYFWSAALGWPLVWDQDQETAIQSSAGGTKISYGGPPVAPKVGKNRLHFDLTADVGDDELSTIDYLESIGATRLEIGHGNPNWTVLADPDGNEFCVLET